MHALFKTTEPIRGEQSCSGNKASWQTSSCHAAALELTVLLCMPVAPCQHSVSSHARRADDGISTKEKGLEVSGLTVRQGGGLKRIQAAPQHRSEGMGRPQPEGCRRTCSKPQQLDSWLASDCRAAMTDLPKLAQGHSLPEAWKAKTLAWQGCSSRYARHMAESVSLPARRNNYSIAARFAEATCR